jgi:hypothetical protein
MAAKSTRPLLERKVFFQEFFQHSIRTRRQGGAPAAASGLPQANST